MASMDIFSGRAFNMITLTDAINKSEHLPTFLGSQNIFIPKPVRTIKVSIEQRNGVLSVIQTSERGAPLEQANTSKRDLRDFPTVRIAKGDTLYAHEIQDIRAFGSESELMQVQAEVAQRLQALNNDVELTFERMRLGAIQGIVLDADNTVIRNWYDEWGIDQPNEIDFELDDPTTDVRGKCSQVIRSMMRASSGAWVEGVTKVCALAGDDFFDLLIAHENVRDTWLNQQQSSELREGTAFSSLSFGGITFYNYRGTDDKSTVAIPADKVKFYPLNAPGVFQVAQSPAETFDYVNTPGQRVYAMLIQDKERGMWVKPEVYAYPLFICTRPGMLQRAKSY